MIRGDNSIFRSPDGGSGGPKGEDRAIKGAGSTLNLEKSTYD